MDSFGNKILRIAIQDKLQAKLGGVGGGVQKTRYRLFYGENRLVGKAVIN